MSQAQKTFIIAISPIKLFGMTVVFTTGSKMRGPPKREKDNEQPTIEMTGITELAALNAKSPTFRVLEGGFYSHAKSVQLNFFGRS